jgi:hypothetical protein
MMIVVLFIIFLSVAAMPHEEVATQHKHHEDYERHSAVHSEGRQNEDQEEGQDAASEHHE